MQGEPQPAAGRFPRPTGLEWLCLVAGILLTLAYAWFLDDAFVYFRYVDNLLYLGRGLVFNEGEFVEGYSSPMWVLVVLALRTTGLEYWLLLRVTGIALFVVFWALLVVTNRRLAPDPRAPGGVPILNLPLLALSLNYGVCCYFTSGMETPLVQVVAVGFALYLVEPRSRFAAVLVGLAPLVRHELALPFLVALLWTWRRRGRFPRLPAAVCAATLGPWMAFRVWYYADLVPNTFHLKDQVAWGQGLAYLHDTLIAYGGYALAAVLAALAVLLRRSRGADGPGLIAGPQRLVMLVCAGLVALYVVRIGGDGRHYRYLAFSYCLALAAAGGIVESALARFGRRLGGAPPAVVWALGLAIGGLTLGAYPRQLSAHPLRANVRETRVGVIRDAQYHRLKEDLAFSPWSLAADTEVLTAREASMLYEVYGETAPDHPVRLRDEYARYLREVRPDHAPHTITDSWCVRMFKRFNERLIHLDGLTDAYLAHMPVAAWRPGHKSKFLRQFGFELSRIQDRHGWGRGVNRAAVEAGEAPTWVADNLEAIEAVEARIYNDHDFLANLGLALQRPPVIEVEVPRPE